MPDKTILVTGANGQLGSEMRLLGGAGAGRYLFTDVAELDITDRKAVRRFVRDHAVDVIVNCAAYTNVEQAERNEPLAARLNRDAAGILADAARERDAVLVHISTDYVFGGDGNLPRREDEPTNPLGVYGRTKLEGEEAIRRSGCRSLIIRTAWLYSFFGNNFVKTMLRLTAERESLNVVSDQVGTPTYAADLARTIATLVGEDRLSGNEGIYHYSNEGVCSWYDFAHEIAALAGRTGCRIRPCRSDEFPSQVERPAFSVLDKTKFRRTFGIEIPYWRDSLQRCIRRLEAGEP